MREAIISGVCTIIAAILAALIPIISPSVLTNPDGVILVRQLNTEVSQSLVVEQFKDMDLRSIAKHITVISLENGGNKDIENFALEIKTDLEWSKIGSGTTVSDNFFTADQELRPSREKSFLATYRRFPVDSKQEIFLLSDERFSVLSIAPNKADVKIAYIDKALWDDVSKLSTRNYVVGAMWLLALFGAVWTILRLLSRRITLKIQKV